MLPTPASIDVNTGPLGAIPGPVALRKLIAERQAELSVLRRLLKVSEDKIRLFGAPDQRETARVR
jgi:hypothetical protein